MESKTFFYKSFKDHQPKEGCEIKGQNYAVICHKCLFCHNLD